MKTSTNCKRCGSCCCNILIYEHEATRIKKYLTLHPELILKLTRPFNHQGCIFLLSENDGTYKCAIYNSGIRPTICKVFGTKGISKLKCPENCFIGTQYTRKQAFEMINSCEKKSRIIGTMNDIMIPFVSQSAKEILMNEFFKEKKQP